LDRYSAIRFAARLQVVAKLTAQIYGLLAVLTLVPCAVCFATGSNRTGGVYLAIVVVLGLLALASRRLPDVDRLQRNEAACIVAIVFVSTSLMMALPIMTYGVGFSDAWFEAASGITTTGLSTLDTMEKPAAFLFSRGWLQWIGGVGVVVLALAILMRSGHAAKRLGFSHVETGDAVGGTRAHARRVVAVYGLLTAGGIVALLIAGATPFDAVVHAMTSVSTGGFANSAASLADSPAAVVGVVDALCVAGAISFHVYYVSLLQIRRHRPLDNQLYALIVLIAGLAALVLVLGSLLGWSVRWQDAVTLVISAQTTAGFSTLDVPSLPAWLMLMLCASMFVGGGIGSTAGGIKIGRLLFVASWVRDYFQRTAVPESAYGEFTIGEEQVTVEDLQEVFAVVGAFVVVLFLSWFCFVLAGYPVLESLFDVVSALATVGMSAGVTSADLPPLLKALLCFDMLFGRVEVVALVIALLPTTWVGRRRSGSPE
jgi:trk system potassium uptake protein TrkH